MNKLSKYMRFLGYQHSISNTNGQIWLFWTGDHHTQVVVSSDQQITVKKHYNPSNCELFITDVYAKCSSRERQDLWADFINVHQLIQGPWCIGGDFNVILDPDENLGGKPHRMRNSFDFSTCMDACEVSDLGFVGPKYTWCNNRKPRKRIWSILGATTENQEKEYGRGLTGCSLMMIGRKSLPTVKLDVIMINMIILNISNSWTSGEVVGNVFEQVKIWEDKMLILEDQDLHLNSEITREALNKDQAEYIKWMNIIRNHHDTWIQGDDSIANAAVHHFDHLFNLPHSFTDFNIVDCVPDYDEIKRVVFSMSASSAGPDGFNGTFYHKCWDIIGNDIKDFILSIRLNPLLDKLISENQSGFVKGRLITENVLLAQVIVHGIKNYKNKWMSWDFLLAVMKKFGFADNMLSLIGNLLAGVWHSIILNGNRSGFFTSTQGLKLDARGPIINHLAYANDIVIFCGGNNKSIKLIKHQIKRYENASGQKVNNNKSFFITAPNTSVYRTNRIRKVSGFMDKPFPFTYLGRPIYYGRKNSHLFDDMLSKIVKKLNGWC
ncbi:uncharacterized protein LOC132619448 [Lycium barbarum]|uniref:uncharacterized protein LOC132619448 n=1 Tax=Lycium barbarum TaxID=112863 RepID=UPI00293E93B3|nr:uncharacterized protein LOC132619448 [Lycium barbarum]